MVRHCSKAKVGLPGTGEHPVRGSDLGDCRLDRDDVAGVGRGEPGDLDVAADSIGEVLGRLRGEDRDVLLESERCVEEHGVDVATGCRASRSKTIRWGPFIVGAVSPEPMMTSRRGSC